MIESSSVSSSSRDDTVKVFAVRQSVGVNVREAGVTSTLSLSPLVEVITTSWVGATFNVTLYVRAERSFNARAVSPDGVTVTIVVTSSTVVFTSAIPRPTGYRSASPEAVTAWVMTAAPGETPRTVTGWGVRQLVGVKVTGPLTAALSAALLEGAIVTFPNGWPVSARVYSTVRVFATFKLVALVLTSGPVATSRNCTASAGVSVNPGLSHSRLVAVGRRADRMSNSTLPTNRVKLDS